MPLGKSFKDEIYVDRHSVTCAGMGHKRKPCCRTGKAYFMKIMLSNFLLLKRMLSVQCIFLRNRGVKFMIYFHDYI